MIMIPAQLAGQIMMGIYLWKAGYISKKKATWLPVSAPYLVCTHLEDYLILRFSWMLGINRPGIKASPNIIRNVMHALFYQQPTKFTVNEIRGMTYAQKLADQFTNILELASGIYHISDTNTHNTYESAKIVARKLGFDEETIDRYILPDHERYKERFRDYRLDHQKIEEAGIHFGTFEENVDACLKDFGWLNADSRAREG